MDSGGANPASAMENPGATLMYIRTPRKDTGFAPQVPLKMQEKTENRSVGGNICGES
jgi:hypothetical protein